MARMTLQEFQDKLDWEGWWYMLTEISSEKVPTPFLKEFDKAYWAIQDFITVFENETEKQ